MAGSEAGEQGQKRPGRPSAVERLREFTKVLEGNAPLSEKVTVRRVLLDLTPGPYSPELVRKTREQLGVSQALFAHFLGVSVQSVQSWEQGRREPSEMACRFMDECRHNIKYFQDRLLGSAEVKTPEKVS